MVPTPAASHDVILAILLDEHRYLIIAFLACSWLHA